MQAPNDQEGSIRVLTTVMFDSFDCARWCFKRNGRAPGTRAVGRLHVEMESRLSPSVSLVVRREKK